MTRVDRMRFETRRLQAFLAFNRRWRLFGGIRPAKYSGWEIASRRRQRHLDRLNTNTP